MRKCTGAGELLSECEEAVSYRVLYGSNRAINMTEVEPQRRISKDGDEGNELSYLFKMICIGKIEDVGQAVEAYMQHNFMSQQSLENYHVAVMELISELYHFMSNNELNAQEISGSVGRLYNELSNFEPVVLKQWLLDFSAGCTMIWLMQIQLQEVTHRQCKGLCAQELQKCGPWT